MKETEKIAALEAQNAALRRLLTAAIADMYEISQNIAFEGVKCGSQCAHFDECINSNINWDAANMCQRFRWVHMGEVEELPK